MFKSSNCFYISLSLRHIFSYFNVPQSGIYLTVGGIAYLIDIVNCQHFSFFMVYTLNGGGGLGLRIADLLDPGEYSKVIKALQQAV